MKMYVETYRPCLPNTVKIRVHKEKDFSVDVLHEKMTAVFEVDCVKTKEEAIACVIEKCAGKGVSVKKVFGS